MALGKAKLSSGGWSFMGNPPHRRYSVTFPVRPGTERSTISAVGSLHGFRPTSSWVGAGQRLVIPMPSQ